MENNSVEIATTTTSNHNLMTMMPPDVLLNIGIFPSVKFLAHGFLLIAESEYFQDTLEKYQYTKVSSKPPMCISISSIDPASFYLILGYIYNKKIELSMENVSVIITAATFLKINGLLAYCKSFLHTQRCNSIALLSTTTPPSIVIKPIPNRPMLAESKTIAGVPSTGSKLNLFRMSKNTPFKLYKKDLLDMKLFSKDQQSLFIRESFTSNKGLDKPSATSELDIACCDGPITFEKVLNKKGMMVTANQTSTNDSKENKSSNVKRYKKCIKNNSSAHFQFFPCKLCGSKFPSYYFMQKHRKYCSSPSFK